MKINGNFLSLKENYLFASVGERTEQFRAAHPKTKLIRLSVGDVTQPLPPAAVQAMHRAAEELADGKTFRGYSPDGGYDVLLEGIVEDYARKGVTLKKDEIFVSDGAKSDLGNLLDLFSTENTVLIPDPVYPVYLDTNRMAGRPVVFAEAKRENDFLPMPDGKYEADIIYLCSPNNPTGAAYSKEQLQVWVDYARERDAVIVYDAAYEAFISGDGPARSIYQVKGAEECAIEVCSFSKRAGFTGVRCGYTVVPHSLVREVPLNRLWRRRQSTKFNGVSYISQMGAAATLTEEGREQTQNILSHYRRNAEIICGCLCSLGVYFAGGEHSPYIWMKCPNGMSSWDFFDHLLERANVVGTPGSGFGRCGEGYFRLTAFGTEEDTREACSRLAALL